MWLGASLLHNYNIIADFDEYNDLTQNIDVTQFYTLVNTILSQNARTLSSLTPYLWKRENDFRILAQVNSKSQCPDNWGAQKIIFC